MIAQQPPTCFGVSWEEKHPECAGGFDPMYTGQAGSKVRARCDFYEQCGRAFKIAETQRHLAAAAPTTTVTSLSRPQQPTYTQQWQHPAQPQQWQRPVQSLYQQPPAQSYQVPVQTQQTQSPFVQRSAPPPGQQVQPIVHPSQFYPAIFSPAQMLLPHEAAPFLTVSEERPEGGFGLKQILFESLRAGAKGMLQQGAFIIDHTRFCPKEPVKK